MISKKEQWSDYMLVLGYTINVSTTEKSLMVDFALRDLHVKQMNDKSNILSSPLVLF